MALPDDLHLAGVVEKIQFKYPKRHGIIDLRLVFNAKSGKIFVVRFKVLKNVREDSRYSVLTKAERL